jgi:beta-glucosidase-like glycosyl hydrolase
LIGACLFQLTTFLAKHYLLNEQEHFRQAYEWGLPNALSSNADDRTLHELYLWPFAESVRAQVGAVMCSYQMVNNSSVFLPLCCAHDDLHI